MGYQDSNTEPTSWDGFQYGKPANTKQNHRDTDNLETVAFWLRNIAITYGFLSIGCVVCGILTLVYAFANIHWPLSSGSGVWSGVLAFLTFIVGFQAFKNYDVRNPAASKCIVITFYTFVIMMITIGGLHLVYSAIGYAYCAQEIIKDNEYQCNVENKARLMLVEGFNIAFGSVLIILSVIATVYMSIRRRMRKLTGMPMEPDVVVYDTCCGGNCKCYSDF